MDDRILVVVDMQNDFITGPLSSPEAPGILDNVVRKVENFDGRVVFTMDTHDGSYSDTQEGRLLPVGHCIKGSDGWRLVQPLADIAGRKGAVIFEKGTFASVSLAEYLAERNRVSPVSSVTLVGVCTDICVVSNALLIKAFLPEVEVRVDSSCVAGVTKEKNDAALETMRSCQIFVD